METNDNSYPPQGLPKQMVYMLNRAIDAMFDNFGDWAQERGVQYRKGYSTSFERDFEELYPLVKGIMKHKFGHSLDEHKLAIIALLAVLTSQPIVVPSNGECHSVNEIVAFFMAVYIVREHQLHRLCNNDFGLRKRIEEKITTLDTPAPFHDSQGTSAAIIDSLSYLSKMVRMASPINANLVPILSVLMFYIDAYSYASLEKIASELV